MTCKSISDQSGTNQIACAVPLTPNSLMTLSQVMTFLRMKCQLAIGFTCLLIIVLNRLIHLQVVSEKSAELQLHFRTHTTNNSKFTSEERFDKLSITVQGDDEINAKIVNYDYIERSVPKQVSRFDYPWRLFHPVSTHLSVEQSNNRVLYSTFRDSARGIGLGHAMLMINTELKTALRLNLTYTHRIMKYFLSTPQVKNISRTNNSHDYYNDNAGSVEQLFGWGAHHRPRRHVQLSICPKHVLQGDENVCPLCNNMSEAFAKNNFSVEESLRSPFRVPIDHVVGIPDHLSYSYRPGNEKIDLRLGTL